jgi:Ca-activated chloride channel homolog
MKSRILLSAVLSFFTLVAFAQSRLVTGLVTDLNASPIVGVSVVVKGNLTGVTTGHDGRYTITVPSEKSVLCFQFVGMKTIEIAIGSRTVINVSMEEEFVSLQEVVAVGYDSNKSSYPAALSGRVAGIAVSGKMRREPQQQTHFNTEGYSLIEENGFRNVANNPLSTFSIDVDNASYSNVRRFINNGMLPPVDAVRSEEMINYFSYNYPEPEGEHPFSISTEVAKCPWNSSNLILQVGLKGKSIEKAKLPPGNIVFLLDVSGSMDSPNKLPLLKSALRLLVNELRPVDRVAIVVYAGAAGIVLESTPGNRKETIISALDRLQAGGSTAGGAGLKLAYEIAVRNYIEGGNNRIILATDGDFNVGASSNAEMERMVEKERERGVFITVLGFGMGNYKDDKMEAIANRGNGNYAYIDNIQEARKVLVSEFGGTLFTIAKDVKIQIEFNPVAVASYRLIGYENRLLNDEDFNDDRKDAGEMGSGHTVTALYEIVPAGVEVASGVDPLRYQSLKRETTGYSGELVTIKLRYKDPAGLKSKLFEQIVSNSHTSFSGSSEDFRFAVAVAAFGMMLRSSEHRGDMTWKRVSDIASSSRGRDEDGYRAEFIRLIDAAAAMSSENQAR